MTDDGEYPPGAMVACRLCPEESRFRVPAPLDPAGAAMMAEHLKEHDAERATEFERYAYGKPGIRL